MRGGPRRVQDSPRWNPSSFPVPLPRVDHPGASRSDVSSSPQVRRTWRPAGCSSGDFVIRFPHGALDGNPLVLRRACPQKPPAGVFLNPPRRLQFHFCHHPHLCRHNVRPAATLRRKDHGLFDPRIPLLRLPGAGGVLYHRRAYVSSWSV